MPNKRKDKPSEHVEISDAARDRMEKMAADLPGLLQYAHNVGGFAIVPTESGTIKHHALQAMHEQTHTQMSQIMEQMQLLAKQAQTLKERVQISEEIYSIKMSFKPNIGHQYFLYQKASGDKFLSIVSPAEWGRKLAELTFIAKVKLLADHTWDVVESAETMR